MNMGKESGRICPHENLLVLSICLLSKFFWEPYRHEEVLHRTDPSSCTHHFLKLGSAGNPQTQAILPAFVLANFQVRSQGIEKNSIHVEQHDSKFAHLQGPMWSAY